MLDSLKILMLEDVEEEAGLVEWTLRRDQMNFQALRVDTAEEFTQALKSFRPDVILSDHALPQFNSIEALKLCQKNGMSIPFILVTGTVSEEFAVNCLKQGVDDYILKSNLSRLPSAIKGAIRQRKMESERLLAELKLRDQNEELMVANESLQKTNHELDNFVYSVSHNLRAPLMSVLGLVRIARGTPDPKAAGELFDMMERSVNRLDETLKEILDYSRNSRTEVEREVIDIAALVDSCIQRVKYLPDAERIFEELIIDEGIVLRTDRYRLTVIFQNLISNAVKYMDSRKERSFIHVNVSREDSFIKISVRDNGIGIAEEQVPLIFNMFHRSSTRSDGAGLGLYIVREAVTKLGGSVDVASQLGEWTRFDVRLPV